MNNNCRSQLSRTGLQIGGWTGRENQQPICHGTLKLISVRNICASINRGVEQNKILEFQAPHAHGCSLGMYKHFLFYWYLTYFLILPLPRQKNDLTNRPKTKGGTLGWKNTFFQKCSPIFCKCDPINCICFADSKNIHIMGFSALRACACSVHAVQSVHGACTGTIGCLDPMLCMFLESAQQMQSFETCLKKIGKHFWKKIFFHPRVPPLVFGMFVKSFFGRGRGKIRK